MKILEINKFYFPKGGADKHFLDLIKLLESKGHTIAVFSMNHWKNQESKWQKYFVSTVGYTAEYSLRQKIKGLFRMFYSLEARKKIKKILDDFQPELVHIHNIYHQISPSILTVIKKRNIPIVMTVHDYKLICPNYLLQGEGYGFWKFIRKKCFKNSLLKSFLVAFEWRLHRKVYEKNIDLYITPSLFVKNKLVNHGIKESKIKALPHFIFNSNTSDASSIFNKIKEKNHKEKYFLYFGRISKNKGVDILVDIFKNLKETQLYLAGEIEEKFKIQELENIKYLGYLNQGELSYWLKNSLAVVSASKLPETFGLVALESLACGKPFFGFKTGAFQEIIQNGENGYLSENVEDFKKAIFKMINGEISFNNQKIKENSFKKYNSENYYRQILCLFFDLTK